MSVLRSLGGLHHSQSGLLYISFGEAWLLPARKRREQSCHFTSEALSIAAATSGA